MNRTNISDVERTLTKTQAALLLEDIKVELKESSKELFKLTEVDWETLIKSYDIFDDGSYELPHKVTLKRLMVDAGNASALGWESKYPGVKLRDSYAGEVLNSSYDLFKVVLSSSANFKSPDRLSSAAERFLFNYNFKKLLKKFISPGEPLEDSNGKGLDHYRDKALKSFGTRNKLRRRRGFETARVLNAKGGVWSSHYSPSVAEPNAFSMLENYGQFSVPISLMYEKTVVAPGISVVDIGGKWDGITISAKKITGHSGEEHNIELFETWMAHSETKKVFKVRGEEYYNTKTNYTTKQKGILLKSVLGEESLYSLDLSESCLTLENHSDGCSHLLSVANATDVKESEGKLGKCFYPSNIPYEHADVRLCKLRLPVIDKRFVAKWTSDSGNIMTCTGTTANRAISVMKRRTRTAILDALDF